MKKLWSAYGEWRHGKKKEETKEKKYLEDNFSAESQHAYWEVVSSQHQNVVQLLFLPEDSSSTRILMTPEQFEDLLELCHKIKTAHNN
jgi:hypothetical protein